MENKEIKSIKHNCFECENTAVWVKYTQFCGDHYFCDKHAREESDFGEKDPSYFFWERYV